MDTDVNYGHMPAFLASFPAFCCLQYEKSGEFPNFCLCVGEPGNEVTSFPSPTFLFVFRRGWEQQLSFCIHLIIGEYPCAVANMTVTSV